VVVDLDEDAVGARSDCGAGHGAARCRACRCRGWDRPISAGGSLAGRPNDAQVQGVAGVVGKGAHAALAEDHFVVSFAHHVFGGHQKLTRVAESPRLIITGLRSCPRA